MPAVFVGIFILFCLGVVVFLYNQNQALKDKIGEYQKQTPIATPRETVEPVATATASATPGVIKNKTSTPSATFKACTLEAKICPNGSSVGRTGPNCEFSPCPTPN